LAGTSDKIPCFTFNKYGKISYAYIQINVTVKRAQACENSRAFFDTGILEAFGIFWTLPINCTTFLTNSTDANLIVETLSV
jgi:hypothetical protein